MVAQRLIESTRQSNARGFFRIPLGDLQLHFRDQMFTFPRRLVEVG